MYLKKEQEENRKAMGLVKLLCDVTKYNIKTIVN
jgi:hypothetical protein